MPNSVEQKIFGKTSKTNKLNKLNKTNLNHSNLNFSNKFNFSNNIINSLPFNDIKSVVILIIVFIFIVSDIFVNNFLILFGSVAINENNITMIGVILQGIFLVITYSIMMYII